MNKKIVITLLTGILLMLAGCSWGQLDETGVYVDSKGYIEVPMGIWLHEAQRIGCTVKIPRNYVIKGGGVYRDGSAYDYIFRGDRLGTYADEGKMDGYAFYHLTYSPRNGRYFNGEYVRGAQPPKEHLFSCSMVLAKGTYIEKSWEEYDPNGVWVGSDAMPGYVYTSTGDHTLRLAMAVQIDEDMVLVIKYGGPLIKELGMEELGERLYSLIEVEGL